MTLPQSAARQLPASPQPHTANSKPAANGQLRPKPKREPADSSRLTGIG